MIFSKAFSKFKVWTSFKTSMKLDPMGPIYNKSALGFVMSWAWWHHQMETFSALLAFCAGNSPVPGEFHAQSPVTRSFDVTFDMRLNKRLSKQQRRWWVETLSRSLWRRSNEIEQTTGYHLNQCRPRPITPHSGSHIVNSSSLLIDMVRPTDDI